MHFVITIRFKLNINAIRYPVNFKTPARYVAAVFIQILDGMFLFHCVGFIMCLAFGMFMFTTSLIEDAKSMLRSINKMARHKKSRKDLYGKLSVFIRTHANGKQLK